MDESQVQPVDVPSRCERCATVTLHRRGTDGEMYCLRCLTEPAPAVQQVVHHHAAQRENSIVGLAKLIASLLFLLMIGTCVYVCGSAAHESNKESR